MVVHHRSNDGMVMYHHWSLVCIIIIYSYLSVEQKWQLSCMDACNTADCCPLLTICPRYCPRNTPDMPQMMSQTCPRWCPRHAPDDAPDMPQMMPQTYLSVSYLISSKRLLFKNIAHNGSFQHCTWLYLTVPGCTRLCLGLPWSTFPQTATYCHWLA